MPAIIFSCSCTVAISWHHRLGSTKKKGDRSPPGDPPAKSSFWAGMEGLIHRGRHWLTEMETAEDENDGEMLWDKILHDHGGVFFWAARVIMVSAVVCAIAWRPGHMERPLGGGGHGGHGPVRHFFLGVRRGPRNLIRRIWGRGESGPFRGRALSPPASQGRPQGRPGRREDTGSQGHSLAPRPRPQLVNKTLLESVEGCMQALDAYVRAEDTEMVLAALASLTLQIGRAHV